ncbi:hypothetical protein [Roseiflexus castenholzii]|uniref:hypothetical protein n=1 Tax=Roseiflexus castenholzii TaxID=120962 RepID=UPI00059D433C|nr:hypothetical protein [Roseiflexus castenholzii]
MPHSLQTPSPFVRSFCGAALLNLLPCLIVCLRHRALRPGLGGVVRDMPRHPAPVGFYAQEQRSIERLS